MQALHWNASTSLSKPTAAQEFRCFWKTPMVSRAFIVAMLLGEMVQAQFSASFWSSIPIGTTVIRSSGAPPLCSFGHNGVTLELDDSVTNCRGHRLLASAAAIDVGAKLEDIKTFLIKLNGDAPINFGEVGEILTNLDFRVLSPSVLQVKTSTKDSVKEQVDANTNAVSTVVANLRNLPTVLDQAMRVAVLRSAVGAVSDSSRAIAENKIQGCGRHKHLFQQRMAELALFDLSFENDTQFTVLQAFATIVIKGMVALADLRQVCDVFGAIDPAVDVQMILDVLIKASKLKKDEAGTVKLEQAKAAMSANPNSFVDGSHAFKNQMTDLLQSKTDLNAAAADMLHSEAWNMAVNGNSAVADASWQLTASILTHHEDFSSKLSGLEKEIETTANVRLAVLEKVDSKVDELHSKKMDQMGKMSTKFSGQHQEKLGRLVKIDNKVQGITVQAKAGFSQIQSKLDTVQANLERVIDGVAAVVKDDAALTTQVLKRSIGEAFQHTQAKIEFIDAKIDSQAAAVQETLANSKSLLQENFDDTNSVIYSASARMSALVASSFQVISSTIVDVAQQAQGIVSNRVRANGKALSEQLLEFDKKVQYVDGRLEVLADQAATLDDKLQITNAILQDLAATAELVAVGIEDLISDIKEIFFQRSFESLTSRYASLRSSYTTVLAAPSDPEAMSLLKLSCHQAKANDLFLSFVNLVDIEDEQIPKQLEAFQFNPAKYQLFGVQVITVLDELSMLATLCSGLLFRDDMTGDDLRRKSTENARMIREAARQFTRHIDEVVPAYMIRQHVGAELEKASTMELGSDAAARAKNLLSIQKRLQANIGSFAKVTVIAAPRSGTISVNHLEEQYTTVDLSNIRRYGLMVSANKAIAVVWGTTQQLPVTESLDKNALLRQGIYRGSLVASQGCTVAQDATFYPRCVDCVCDHYEDFASVSSSRAGRLVTVFNSTSPDSDFEIATVFESHVDYFMEQIQLDVVLNSPTLAAIRADTITKRRQKPQHVLWEGYSDNGKFNVVPGDVKGTLLSTNELTLTLSPRANSSALRRVVPLFCNGKRQEVRYNTTATLTYACRELPRKSLDESSEVTVARGIPIGRLDAAVCVGVPGSSVNMHCRVTGGFDSISMDATALHIGRFVHDVTAYEGQGLTGDFAVCKGCTAVDLLAHLSSVGSIVLKSPNTQLLPYLAATCSKVSDTILACLT